MATGKRYTDAAERVNRERLHSLAEAVGLVKQLAGVSFDETVELAARLGVDPRKAEEMVRGTVALPSGTGRDVRVAVFAAGESATKAKEAGRQITGFETEAVEALRRYAWPGNVRELENVVERAVVLSRATSISLDDLPRHVIENSTGELLPRDVRHTGRGAWPTNSSLPLREALEEPERQIILAALEANDWNRQKTADQLDINRTTLYKKIKQYGLEQYGRAG